MAADSVGGNRVRVMPDSGKSNITLIVVGILTSAIGMIPLLATLGVLPHGHDPADPAPSWIGWLIGLAFACGGISVVIRGVVGSAGDMSGALPLSAPRLLRAVYDLLAVTIVGSLAMLFSWVAFGPGARHFAVSTGGLSMPTSGAGDTMGRVAFGFGAVLIWCGLAAIVVMTVRRWRR